MLLMALRREREPHVIHPAMEAVLSEGPEKNAEGEPDEHHPPHHARARRIPRKEEREQRDIDDVGRPVIGLRLGHGQDPSHAIGASSCRRERWRGGRAGWTAPKQCGSAPYYLQPEAFAPAAVTRQLASYRYPAAWSSNSFAYRPPAATSSLCEPNSAMCPSAPTAIPSAMRTVEKRCEMTMPIRPFRLAFNSAKMPASASGSSDDVGSSRIQMSAFRYM